MHVVVFGSGSGTNLEALLRAEKAEEHPSFQIKALVTDRSCRFEKIGLECGIPVICNHFDTFIKEQGIVDLRNPGLRSEFDKITISLLKICAAKYRFSIDLIVLAGYMRLLSPYFLNAFPRKVINVHPADLTVKNPDGSRAYIGANGIGMALTRGEKRTRSTVFVVDEGIDQGPILTLGPWVDYHGPLPPTKDSIIAHQEKQKIQSDWPTLVATVELISEGYFQNISENSVIDLGEKGCAEYLELSAKET